MKKAQLTLYIILGMIFVISAIFIITIKDRETVGDQDIVRRIVEDTPETIKPVKIFVEECLQDITVDGLKRLGTQGGYIDVSGFSRTPLKPTDSEVIDFFNDGSMIIPYWWHLRSDDESSRYSFESKRPSLYRSGGESIEEQLDGFIENNLLACLDDFDDFKDFSVIKEGDPVVRVTIRDYDLLTQLYYPLSIEYQGVITKVDLFNTILDIALPSIYETATNIVNNEMNSSIFEIYTMNLIAAFSGMDKNQLPPTDASSFDPGKYTFWTLTATKNKIQEMLQVYVPMLQVYGSLNYRFIEHDNSLAESLYGMRILPSYGKDEADFVPYEIDFTYLDIWSSYVDMEGRGVRGELIGPERATTSFFPWVAISRFQNYYDVSYPMVVEIYDPLAFNGRGYTFMYAIEVNVRDNFPINLSYTQPLQMDAPAMSLFCDLDKRNSGIVDIRTYDIMTNESLKDIPVYYYCGESCLIGISNSDGMISTRLPLCYGGRLSTQSYDYWSAPIRMNAIADKEETVELGMYEIIDMPASLKKMSVTKIGNEWGLLDAELFLNHNAEGIVVIKKIKKDPVEQTLTSSFFVRGDDNTPAQVRLVPGEYEVSIMNLLHETVTVPEGEICVDTGVIISNEECTTLDSIDFDEPFPYGGLELDNTFYNGTGFARYWNITEDLYQRTDLLFFTLAMPDAVDELTHMDLELLGLVGEYSAKFREKVEPRFS